MKTIKAVYKRLGDILVFFSDDTRKKLEDLTESELKRVDNFCSKHHIYTDGNIIEYAGAIQPLHCVIVSKKPFAYTAITTHGTLTRYTEKSPQEIIQRLENYIKTCTVNREQSANCTKYSCGEGGL